MIPVYDFRCSHPVCNFHCGVDQLPVVPPVKGHPVVPEVLEEVRQNLVLDVLSLNTVCSEERMVTRSIDD